MDNSIIGNNNSEKLMDMISLIEKELSKKAIVEKLPMQPGDVKRSFADIDHSIKMLNFKPKTSIEQGIPKFIDWYQEYANSNS